MVINKFLKNKKQFAYIRRYKSELKSAVPSFFQEIIKNNEFPNTELSTKGNKFYCNKEICGYALTLSTSQDLKSTNFSNVNTIIFDEFIIDPRTKKELLK